MFFADFHIHSKYSRATSPQMDLENLDKWARIKGIKVLGTGDFTHPEWFRNLKEKLILAAPGLFKFKAVQKETKTNKELNTNGIQHKPTAQAGILSGCHGPNIKKYTNKPV